MTKILKSNGLEFSWDNFFGNFIHISFTMESYYENLLKFKLEDDFFLTYVSVHGSSDDKKFFFLWLNFSDLKFILSGFKCVEFLHWSELNAVKLV